MPRLVSPVVPVGRMRDNGQPALHASPALVLRAWSELDVPNVMAAFADPDIRHWHMRGLPDRRGRALVDRGLARTMVRRNGRQLAIAETDTDDLVGQVALRMISLEFGQGQITYWVLPASRRLGIATRTVTEVSRWAFDELGLHRLEIRHSVANPWSCRVADKVGFPLEGTMRSSLLHEDGWHDMHMHARIAPD